MLRDRCLAARGAHLIAEIAEEPLQRSLEQGVVARLVVGRFAKGPDEVRLPIGANDAREKLGPDVQLEPV